ncbi:MAG TPA: hypothetical protein VJ697_12955, partial [Nitrososphaeraceae archaeon]|nr:hypothetical protein [Nitrososphaeraceae archaeon]
MNNRTKYDYRPKSERRSILPYSERRKIASRKYRRSINDAKNYVREYGIKFTNEQELTQKVEYIY